MDVYGGGLDDEPLDLRIKIEVHQTTDDPQQVLDGSWIKDNEVRRAEVKLSSPNVF